MFLFCVGSLLQCFRVRIRAQIFPPNLGSMRSPPLLLQVTPLLINTNLLTSYVSVYIHKSILNSSLSWSNSSQTNPGYKLLCFSASYGFTQHFLFLVLETLLCSLLYFINSEDVATMEIPLIFFFKRLFVTSYILRFTLFTSTLFRFSVFKFVFRRSFLQKKEKKRKKYLQKIIKIYGKS